MEVGIKVFDLSADLTNGLYFIQIQADENIIMKRFILQKE